MKRNTFINSLSIFNSIMLLLAVGLILGYYQPKIEGYQVQVANLTSEVAKLEQTVSSLEQTVSSQESRISTQETTIDTQTAQIATRDARILTQETQISTLTSEKSKLQTNLSIAQYEISTQTAQISTLASEKSNLQNEKTQMSTQYSSLRSKIMARMGSTQQDRQSYITPRDTTVSAKVQEITGGDNGDNNKSWSDYQKMYTWIVDNIDYSYDSSLPVLPKSISDVVTWKAEFWRTPAETLKDKTGDCEDMSLLLISMLESYNKTNYAVWTLSIVSKAPELKGHMAVALPVEGGKLTILDPAGNYYTGIQSGYLRSESIASAVNSWLSHWSEDMPNAFIDGVMSEKVDRQFSSSDEFIRWASQQ